MKVLVTGAAGLIGGEAVRAFARAGVEVVGIVRASRAPGSDQIREVAVDLRDPAATRSLIDCAPDVVVHAAAVLPRRFEGEDAIAAARENRAIDDVVLAATASLGCPLIFISSTSVYGCVQTSCTESSPVAPRGAYGAEKIRSEEKVLGLRGRTVILRISAPYGARQRFETVLRRFISLASRGEDLRYYGTGAREQDFTAVEDVSAAIVAAATATSEGIFNVASGQPIAMRDLARLVIQTVGATTSKVLAAGVDDPEEHCRARVDITRAAAELHWRPTIDLASGIRRLAANWRGNPGPSQNLRQDPSTSPQ